ncbi:MAG TPA: hypothetical protein VM711_06805 [Sphingomicrobium sp.]|nr:hypothetical protein [Sphingomicrobium sp.]
MQSMLKGILVVFAAWCFLASAFAVEKTIAKSDLPPAVQKTAAQQSAGSSVISNSKDREGGKLEYEVQMKVNGHSKDVTIAPDGQLLEIEEEVSKSDLSPEVAAALEQKAGKGKIAKIESLTKNGKIVAYEAQVVTRGKRSEVQVGPRGQTLSHEE